MNKLHVNRWKDRSIGLCKRTQQVTTLLHVVGGFWPTMLRPFADGPKSLTGFKLDATSANKLPILLWFHANGRSMLGPTVLRVVAQQCCVRLHEP